MGFYSGLEKRVQIGRDVWRGDDWMEYGQDPSGRAYGLIPNYQTCSLDPWFDFDVGSSVWLSAIEIDAVELVRQVGVPEEKPVPPAIDGGTFRLVGGRWEVSCGGTTAMLPPTKGLAVLCVLLSHPGEIIEWPVLDEAAVMVKRLVTLGDAMRRARAVAVADTHGSGDRFMAKEELDRIGRIIANPRQRSVVSMDEIERMKAEVAQLRRIAVSLSGAVSARLLKQANESEAFIKSMQNDARRSESPADKVRWRVYNLLKQALAEIAHRSPALARHLGSLDLGSRRSFLVEDGGIAYVPPESVTWDTVPLGRQLSRATQDSGDGET